jgi:hypothetical protein
MEGTDMIGKNVIIDVSNNIIHFPADSPSGNYFIKTTFTDGNILVHKVMKK